MIKYFLSVKYKTFSVLYTIAFILALLLSFRLVLFSEIV